MKGLTPIIGTIGTGITLAHINEIVGCVTGLLTLGYVGLKFWIRLRKELEETHPKKKAKKHEHRPVDKSDTDII